MTQETTGSDLGPYRTPETPESTKPKKLPWFLAGIGVLGLICIVSICRNREGRPSVEEIPKDLLKRVEVFPLPEADLKMATPLAPLLVADRPESLAVLSPREGAKRLRRGESLAVRFNRPMVEGRQVGRELEGALPVRFEPAIEGTFEWRSRGTLVFRPAPGAWGTGVTESNLLFSPELSSLDGESLEDDYERVLVLDGSPRIIPYRANSRVNVGAPLPLFFDAPVSVQELSKELLAYEIEGGQRSLPISVTAGGEDESGAFRINIQPRKNLEPGSRIGLAVTPRFLRWGGYRPGVFEYELTPRPRIEGIDCHESSYSASQCTFTQSPGHIIDIGPALRLVSSANLGEVSPADVRIIPPLSELRVSLASEGEAARRLVTIRGEWQPDQVYEVRLGRLRTQDGELLRPLAPLAVRSAGHPAAVRVETGRLTYEEDAQTVLRFAAINAEKGQVIYRSVPSGRELEAAISSRDFLDSGEATFALAPLAPTARPNRWGVGEFQWREEGERNSEMAVVGFWPSSEQHRSTISTAFMQSTDLGVTLRGSERDLLVWVTSLSSGEPVQGAQVTVVTDQRVAAGDGRTDGDGVALIHVGESPLRTTHAVLVVKGDDRAIVLLDPRRAVAPYGMGLTPGEHASAADRPVASIFADRGAYRPGEKLRAKLTARQVREATATPLSSTAVTVRLFTPVDTAPLAETDVTLNRWGTAQVSFDIPSSAPLGDYSLEVFSDREAPSIGSTDIQVAQFRQPTFRVDMTTPEGELHDGDSLPFTVSALYLFGAPVGEGELSWSVVRNGAAPYPERWNEYRFSAIGAATPSGTLASDEIRLDREGRAELSSTVSVGVALRARLQIEGEVTDRAGHTYATRRSLVVYPAAYEVGVRQGDDWISMGEELDLDTIVIDHQGELVAGRTVTARFVREGWHSWWEWSPNARSEGPLADEGFRLRRNRRDEEVFRCELSSASTPVHCLHTPTRPGTYLLEVTTQDDEGRTSVASRRLYVAGPDEHPDRDPPGAPLTVTPTRRRWSVGEEAELAFESPWPDAQALITVEREGVLHTERRQVGSGGQVVRIPLTEAMVPNVFVGVTLVRPRVGEPEAEIDLNAPDLRFGVTELRVQPETSEFQVSIDMATEARSGTEVPITVQVADVQGRPVQAEVALWAVDEGTLRLTDYQVPNPTGGIFRSRAAAFAWEDLRRALVSRIEPPPLPMSGGGGRGDASGGPPLPEGEAFDPTPLWEPHLITDAQGRAQATLTLPHRETEYRVMAVVLDDGIRWGSASSSITANQPLVVRPAFPRFVRAGDQFEATIFIHNTTDELLQASVSPTIGDDERQTRTLEIAPHAEIRLGEPVTVPSEGPLELSFEAEAQGYTTTAERELTVLPAGRWVRSQALGASEPGEGIPISLPEGTLRTGGAITVTVASHPFLGFDGAVEALEDSYWEGCRTLSATLLAMASYAELGLEGRPGAPSPAELAARAEQIVRRLLDLQNFEGGFGRWSSREISRPRETAFALFALQRAGRAGFEVPEEAVNRSREHLVELAIGHYFGDGYGLDSQDELAFALRVLSEGDAVQSERIDALYEQRERLTPYGLAQLAMAMGEDDPRTDTLVTQASEQVLTDRDDEAEDPSRLRWYDHSTRVYGAVLEAAVGSDVGRRHTKGIATKLLELRRGDLRYPWSTSLETANALAALSSYAKLFQLPDASQAQVRLGERTLEPVGGSRDAAWYRLPFEELLDGQRNLQIQSGDDGPLFFSIDGRWALPLGEGERHARGEVVALHRVFETSEGRPLEDGEEIPLGTMIRVRLFVFTEDQPPPMVALRDPLGAGFESVDSNMDSTPRQSLNALFGMSPDDDVADPRAQRAMRSVYDISHRRFDTAATTFFFDNLRSQLSEFTYAVRATTVGEFTMPPAQIEALYTPDYVGRSAATRLVVVEPSQGRESTDDEREGDPSPSEAEAP